MRRLVTAIGLLLISTVAAACSFRNVSDHEAYAEASHIFVARVLVTKVIQKRSEQNGASDSRIVRAKVETLEILKGNIRNVTFVEGAEPYKPGLPGCYVELIPGETYLFVLRGSPRIIEGMSSQLEGTPPSAARLDAFRKLRHSR